MDDFENDLARMMREASDSAVPFGPARRERLYKGVRTRRRNRSAWVAAGSVLAAGFAGLLLVGMPGGGTSVSPPAAASASPSTPGLLVVPKNADPATRSAYREANATASCMWRKGFLYTPHVVGAVDAYAAVDGADYGKAKEFRSKFGYGIYAGAVYPDNPDLVGSKANLAVESPDAAYIASLSPARKAAYETALGSMSAPRGKSDPVLTGCSGQAERQVEGPPKSPAEKEKEIRAWNAQVARQDHVKAQLDHEPELVTLASSYALCLKSHHIEVTTENPSDIGDMVKFQESSAAPADGITKMSQHTARERLKSDITVALVDLDCGKEFRAAYFPELKRLS